MSFLPFFLAFLALAVILSPSVPRITSHRPYPPSSSSLPYYGNNPHNHPTESISLPKYHSSTPPVSSSPFPSVLPPPILGLCNIHSTLGTCQPSQYCVRDGGTNISSALCPQDGYNQIQCCIAPAVQYYAHYGLDLSAHNHISPINYTAVLDYLKFIGNGASPFIIRKTTEGVTYIDEYIQEDIGNFTAGGAAVSVYHFEHPDDGIAPQLSFLLSHTYGQSPLTLDCEVTDDDDWPVVIDVSKGLLDGMGDTALLYSYPDFLTNLTGQPFGHPLWYANYDAYPDRECIIWQYNSVGNIDGIVGETDVNMFLGGEAEWELFITNKMTGKEYTQWIESGKGEGVRSGPKRISSGREEGKSVGY